MPSCELHKTTKTIGYAPLFVLLFVKGKIVLLSSTLKRKLSNDEKEFECKDITQFSFNIWEKMSLVNETLRPETETFDFQSETRSRPRRSHISPRPRRDRDVGKMRLETVSRPRRRDRDYIPAQCVDVGNDISISSEILALYKSLTYLLKKRYSVVAL